MRMTLATRITSIGLAIALAVVMGGCSDSRVEFVDLGRSYDEAALESLLGEVDAGELSDEPADAAPELRQRALADLRRTGGSAVQAAELLTTMFPASTIAVPYYVESARYRGEDVLVLLEARGRSGEMLTSRRLWVLGADGEVLLSRLR